MAELETAITTQEQLDKIIGERLKREQKKYEGFISPEDFEKRLEESFQKKSTEYSTTIENLQKDLEEKKAVMSKHEQEVNSLNAKIKTYETSAVKQRVAHETGIPYELAARLKGESEDEIRKDAEALSKLVVKKSTPPLRSDETDNIDTSRAALKNMLDKVKEN